MKIVASATFSQITGTQARKDIEHRGAGRNNTAAGIITIALRALSPRVLCRHWISLMDLIQNVFYLFTTVPGDPCKFAFCAKNPNAVCRPSSSDKTKAEFLDDDFTTVIKDCGKSFCFPFLSH